MYIGDVFNVADSLRRTLRFGACFFKTLKIAKLELRSFMYELTKF